MAKRTEYPITRMLVIIYTLLRDMRQHKWKFVWCFILLMTFNKVAFAVGVQSPNSRRRKLPTGTGMGEIIVTWVDIAHAEISKRILNTSERFDAFFGDERIDEEIQNTQIKIRAFIEIIEGQDTKLTFPLSVNMALPHLKNRWHLAVETIIKENKDLENGGEEKDKDDNDADDNVTLSLRYKIMQEARRWLSLDTGVKIGSAQIEPFSQLRARRTVDLDPWALRLTQFIRWFENDGWGETSRIDIDRRIHRNTFFRMTSEATWSESNDGMELKQTFFLRQRLSDNRAIELKLNGEGYTEPVMAVDKYGAKLTFRRRLYKDWVFFGIEPGVQFLREDDFALSPLITFNFEFKFGDVSEP